MSSVRPVKLNRGERSPRLSLSVRFSKLPMSEAALRPSQSDKSNLARLVKPDKGEISSSSLQLIRLSSARFRSTPSSDKACKSSFVIVGGKLSDVRFDNSAKGEMSLTFMQEERRSSARFVKLDKSEMSLRYRHRLKLIESKFFRPDKGEMSLRFSHKDKSTEINVSRFDKGEMSISLGFQLKSSVVRFVKSDKAEMSSRPTHHFN